MHVPPVAQYFCPLGQIPLQGAFCAMQTPLQSCGRLDGQVWMQAVPLQATVPPVGAWQAVLHSVRPQVATELLLTHTPLQLCQPELQRTAQVPFWQIAVPLE